MNVSLGTGLLLVLAGLAFVISAAVRRGPRYEYALAMFFAEMGMVFVSGQIIPDGMVQICVKLAFITAMVTTAVIWRKLFIREQMLERRRV